MDHNAGSHAPNAGTEVHRLKVGREQRTVLCIDNFEMNGLKDLREAAANAEFGRPAGGHYPGIRAKLPRPYCERVVEAAIPLMRDAFDLGMFECEILDAAFSLVTIPAAELTPLQSVPHVDTPDPARFALLHFLCEERFGGTAFFRQKATGFETITPERAMIHTIARDRVIARGRDASYVGARDSDYDRIAEIAARFGRLLIYPSNLLHSGAIGDANLLSADPRLGRLTANIFLQARAQGRDTV